MKSPIPEPREEYLMSELIKQLEAYNLSLINDEIFEVRKKIALRIVEIEKNLMRVNAVPTDYSNSEIDPENSDVVLKIYSLKLLFPGY